MSCHLGNHSTKNGAVHTIVYHALLLIQVVRMLNTTSSRELYIGLRKHTDLIVNGTNVFDIESYCYRLGFSQSLLVVIIRIIVDHVEESELVDTLAGRNHPQPIPELLLLQEFLGPMKPNISSSSWQ